MENDILLISDRSPIFPELARLWSQAGYRVTLAFHGREAWQALRGGSFSLVVTRFSKDWTETRPFQAAVKELNREISVLFLSSRAEPSACPTEAFLIKINGDRITPVGWGGLRHLVNACLGGRPTPAVREAADSPERPRQSKVSYLEFRRTRHAPQQPSAT